MGLLDSFDDPNTVGLLSMGAGLLNASGPSRMPVSLGQALGQGLQSGLQGYQGTQQLLQQRALQQQQLDSQRTDNLLHKAQTDKMLHDMAKQQKIDDLAPQFYRAPQSAASVALGQGAQAGDVGPTLGNAARLPTAQATSGGFDMPGYMQALSKIDPLAAMKMAADARKADEVTLKDGESVWNRSTGTMLYGNDPKPDMTFIPGDGYRQDVVFDKRTGFVPMGGQVTGRPGFPAPGGRPQQQMTPQADPQQQVDPNAPWRGMPPKQADEMRRAIYEQESKKLNDIRTAVARGRDVLGDLDKFGELNRGTSTGSLYDKWAPTSWHTGDAENQMIAIQNRLGPMARPAGAGSTSNWEGLQYLSALPGIDKSGNANRDIRDDYQRRFNQSVQELQFKEDYLTRYGHLNGADSAYQRAIGGGAVPQGQKTPAATTPPKTMQIVDGYIFLGGDPADPTRWRKQR